MEVSQSDYLCFAKVFVKYHWCLPFEGLSFSFDGEKYVPILFVISILLSAGCYDFSLMDIISYGKKDLMLVIKIL